jgi:mannosyltransferase
VSTLAPPPSPQRRGVVARTGTALRGLEALGARVRDGGPWVVAGGLLLLVVVSVLLRSQAMYAKYWIDEGLSVQIAAHGFLDIPGVLRQDGSPPLYYMLLHVWVQVVGDGEARTHLLSLIFATATIPAAFWAGTSLFGRAQGWGCAVIAAFIPYLTYYAQETRMYALVVLLSVVVAASFAHVFARRDRRLLPVFALSGTAAIYTHNWALFLLAAAGAAWLVLTLRVAQPGEERRGLLRDGVLGFGTIGLLYLPWVPTLLHQAANTGAPWSETPGLEAIPNALGVLLGGPKLGYLISFVGVAGAVALTRARRGTPATRSLALLLAVAAGGILLAFAASQVSPAWANRYFAAFVGPLVLLLGTSLTAQGRMGVAALAVFVLLGTNTRERELNAKSNAFAVARTLDDKALVAPGDLVVSTHPEYGPVMHFYLPDGLRWANALGPVKDPLIFDWTDALDRLEARGPVRVVRGLLPTLRPGQKLVLVQPIIRTGRWGAPWTRLVRRRAQQWERTLDHLPQLRRIEVVPRFGNRRLPRGVRTVLYVRTDEPALPASRVTPVFR